MKELILSWNYKKHACSVTSLYLIVAVVGNCLLGTFKKVKNHNKKPISKKEKLFNGILASCYIIDMTLAFQIIKVFQKQMPK